LTDGSVPVRDLLFAPDNLSRVGAMQPLIVHDYWNLLSDDPPSIEQFGVRFLAEGDSWFSIGTLNPAKNSNLLFEMAFSQECVAVQCATPGDTMRRMSQMQTDPRFIDLLCGRRQRNWDAILLSGGGNDLISALRTPPVLNDGTPVSRENRLLLKATEWGPASDGVARYLSSEGWDKFSTYMHANFDDFVKLRERGLSAGRPIFFHGYSTPTPRPSGAGRLGPWLLPAMETYAIPSNDHRAVIAELISRLNDLLAQIAADTVRYPALHFFDTRAIALAPADANDRGESGDWINEIHPNSRGYEKIALPWAQAIENQLAA
jgi:lysophospholipase L1-like esterase